MLKAFQYRLYPTPEQERVLDNTLDRNGRLTAPQSKRREKAKVLLAKAHLRVSRARLDFHHKTAYALVRCFDTLYVEHLNIRGMLKNHHLARVISVPPGDSSSWF